MMPWATVSATSWVAGTTERAKCGRTSTPFRLCLNKAAAGEIIRHAKHYTGRGVMKYYATGEELAKDMGVPVSKLVETHDIHYQAATKQEKDPDGGSFPA